MEERALLCDRPQAVDAKGPVAISVGTDRSVVVPSPSRPDVFEPQQYRAPAVVSAPL